MRTQDIAPRNEFIQEGLPASQARRTEQGNGDAVQPRPGPVPQTREHDRPAAHPTHPFDLFRPGTNARLDPL